MPWNINYREKTEKDVQRKWNWKILSAYHELQLLR